MNIDILLEYQLGFGDYSLVIDEENSVCYAYLKMHGVIVNHVWLYNRGESPNIAPWTQTGIDPPFKNSSEYILDLNFQAPKSEDDFSISILTENEESFNHVDILIKGICFGRFMWNIKPGYAKLSKSENRLAKPLSDLQNGKPLIHNVTL